MLLLARHRIPLYSYPLTRLLLSKWAFRAVYPNTALYAAAASMSNDIKRRKVEVGSAAGSPVASLVVSSLEGFDSEILASHEQGDTFKVPGGLICTDHSFRTALDYTGEVSLMSGGYCMACTRQVWSQFMAVVLDLILSVQ